MGRVLLVLIVIMVVAEVIAFVDCALMPSRRITVLPKWAWLLVILLTSGIGALLWFLFGRVRESGVGVPVGAGGYGSNSGGAGSRVSSPSPFRGGRRVAPDDDSAFLRNLSADERVRKLEEELKKLEAEDFGPKQADADSAKADATKPDTADPDATDPNEHWS